MHDESPYEIPHPGRHSHHEPVSGLRAVVVDAQDRWGFTLTHLALVGVAFAVVLAFIGWRLLDIGGEAAATQPVATPASASPIIPDPSADPSAGASASPSPAEIVVHVVGKVKKPGVQHLPEGARVAQALRQAGGRLKGISLRDLNLARVLEDGEQVRVGIKRAPRRSGTAQGGAGDSPDGLVNLNRASSDELEELPGVGPVTATAIITFRETNGGFASTSQLIEIDGIGEVTMAKLKPLVTV